MEKREGKDFEVITVQSGSLLHPLFTSPHVTTFGQHLPLINTSPYEDTKYLVSVSRYVVYGSVDLMDLTLLPLVFIMFLSRRWLTT